MLKNFNNFLNNKDQEKPVYTVYDLLTVTKNIEKKSHALDTPFQFCNHHSIKIQ